MARTSQVIEGTVKAKVGIKIDAPHSDWQVVAEIDLPYKLRIYPTRVQEQTVESEETQ